MKRILIPILLALCLLLGVLAAAIHYRAKRAEESLRAEISELSAENGALRSEALELQTALDGARAEASETREANAALIAEAQERAETSEALALELNEKTLPDRIRANRRVTEHTMATAHASEFRYLLYEPGVASDEPLPLVLFLHGSGGILDIYDGDTIPTMLTRGWLCPNALVVMPQCPGTSWEPYCEDLMELLESVAQTCGADRNRISVTGFSLGGVACFSMLVNYPTYFSAAMPLAAKCFPEKCGEITTTPLRIYHGEKDPVMDPSSVMAATEVINAAGGECTLIMLPGEEHMIQQHYLDEGGEPIEWLIAQRRPG